MIATSFLLIESLIINYIYVCEAQPGNWLRNLINVFQKNDLVNLVFNHKVNQNDETALVEDEDPKKPMNNEIWQYLANIIDRVLTIIFFLFYIIMIFTLVPMTYIVAGKSPK